MSHRICSWAPSWVLGGAALLLATTACEQHETALPTVGSGSAAVEGVGSAAERGKGKPGRGPRGGKHAKGKGDRSKGAYGAKGGAMALLHHALRDLELTDEQKEKLEALRTECKRSGEDRGDHDAFNKALADGVRAGKIDDAAVTSRLEALEKKNAERREKMVKTLESLHGILTADQRTAVVASVRKRQDRAAGPPWIQDDDTETDQGGPPRKGKRWGHFGKMKMFRGLDLTDEQREKVEKALEDLKAERPSPEEMKKLHDERRAQMDAVLDAFAKDTFDAAASLGEEPAKKAGQMLEHKVKMLEALVPILDEAQRGKLADQLERKGRGGRRKGGPPDRVKR